MLSTFDKHDKTQLLTKFKKILYMGLRATLNFRKFIDGHLLTTYFVKIGSLDLIEICGRIF